MVVDETRTCRRCGASMNGGARFCSACGAAVEALEPTVIAMTEPQVTPAREPTPPSRGIPPMRIPAGTVLSGVYTVQSVLGEGGMGVVYRAHDSVLDRAVAIKCLHTNLAGDNEIRRRFIREARVLRTFSHPHVVSVFDLVEHEHLLGIVMELVDGKSLAHHLAKWRGRMPFEEIREIFSAVLDAMDTAHRQGIVHRDLKPDNVLVARAPGGLLPKVVDFGIARILEGTTYTVSGALLGTCRYMSPEQVKGEKTADHRSDIYSLGVTLYEIAAGRPPFADDNHFALMMAHVQQAPAPPSRFRPDIPPALERLILDALAKSPAERPQTCEALRERLLSVIEPAAPASVAAYTVSSVPPLASVLRDTDGAEAVLVPAGPFIMGPNRREVFLDAFYMDRTPVTNRQFARFMQVTGYRPADPQAGAGRFLAHWARGAISRGIEDHPVVNVSWDDACAYASWAGKRLPTEAEWEKAARGTDGRKYPWGKAEPGPTRAHFGGKHRGTAPVGAYPEGASPYGILDMAGNVWEWCEDVDDPGFYADGPSRNPRSTLRPARPLYVMRGGSWLFGAQSLRTYSRTSFEPHYRFASGGFRCARSAR